MKGNALIHYVKYFLGMDKPETQTTAKERGAIKKYAAGSRHAVEIGVFEGVNTVTIAAAMHPEGKLIGIDPFFKGRLGICYHEKIARKGISKAKLNEKVKLLPVFSYDAVHEIPGDIDFIFIDGDHSYDGFTRDWNDWSGKVKTGGIIALHDTAEPPHDSSVKELGSYKYFNDQVRSDKRFEIIETVDSLNVLKRIITG
ncbi:MAG: class I SAM-dependent methyltransferase [Ferruginibacter sp.]|nr:class I SAM-dependent methyltransferase [Ferruginibacter sp.]